MKISLNKHDTAQKNRVNALITDNCTEEKKYKNIENYN